MSMEQAVLVALPLSVRQVFARWGEQCDPAPQCHDGLYRELGAMANLAELAVARRVLARIHADAVRNMQFGQFAELRREGALVYPWIAQVVAADPVLCDRSD